MGVGFWLVGLGWIASNVDLFSYAETGEYFTEQIIGGKFAGDFGERVLGELEFFGKKLDLPQVLQSAAQVLASFVQRAQVPRARHEHPFSGGLPADHLKQLGAQQVHPGAGFRR